jgi:signal transduction histidine kinase/ABC-type amino acid transport substrate-binding protein/ActR/RegA family two-component response regulator
LYEPNVSKWSRKTIPTARSGLGAGLTCLTTMHRCLIRYRNLLRHGVLVGLLLAPLMVQALQTQPVHSGAAQASALPTATAQLAPVQPRTLRVGWFERGQSFLDYEDEYGIHQGLNPDFLHHIAALQGLTLTYKYFESVPQTLSALDRGIVDVVPTLLDDSTRRAQYWISPTYSTQAVGAVLRPGIPAPTTLQDLNGYRIASEPGSVSHQRLQAALDHARFVPVNSIQEGIEAVAQGDADAYIGLQTVNLDTIARLGLGTLRAVALPKVMIDLHFAARRDDARTIASITRGLESILPKQRAAIEAHWLSELPPMPGNPIQPASPAQLAWLRQHTTLKIGIYSFRKPYDFLDDTNRWRGTGASILSAFAIAHHLRIEPILLSALSDPFDELRDGDIDAIAAVPVANVTPGAALVSRSYDAVPWLLLDRANAKTPLASIGAQTWRIPHLSPVPEFAADQLIPYTTSDDAVDALQKHDIDAVFVNQVAADRLAAELKSGKIQVDKRFSAIEKIGFAMAPDNTQLQGLLNDFLNAYPADQLREIAQRNHPTAVNIGNAPKAIFRVAAPIFLAVFALFGIVFWAYWRVRRAGKVAAQARYDADRARERAETADQAKSVFLATMSHEIRTPLSGIVGVIDVLQTTPLTQFQWRYIDLARQSTKLLMGVINDVLDFSKIEAGKLVIEASPVNLYQLAENLGGLYAPLTRQKNIGFFISAMPHFDKDVMVDEVRVSQILTNLISNAIRFTESGYVQVKLSHRYQARQSMLQLSVMDTGTGMPTAYLDHLFEPFVQADGSTTRRFGGTGLGLSIVKRLVDLMQGKIIVSSTLNQGTRVEITLPVNWGELRRIPLNRIEPVRPTAALAVHTAPVVPALRAWLIRMKIELVNDAAHADWVIYERFAGQLTLSYRGTEEKPFISTSELPSLIAAMNDIPLDAPDSRPPHPSHQLHTEGRLMVVEDNEINRDIIEQQLILLGLSPSTAYDGVDALKQWRENPPALMLVDCQMPRMDGYELTRQIRAAEIGTGSRTVVIAITANASTADENDCLAAGMDDFLSKPLTRHKLDTMLRKWHLIGTESPLDNRT